MAETMEAVQQSGENEALRVGPFPADFPQEINPFISGIR
jgi:hypothetical protein